MNSGQSSTKLNDMLTDFVDYVDSFYGLNDPIYPMTYKDTGLPLTKVDILGATEKYLSLCAYYENKIKIGHLTIRLWCGAMETHSIERELETFYLTNTTWRSNHGIKKNK